MLRVLIIEDEPAYQRILKDAFEKAQYTVQLARDAKEGLLDTADSKPDIILLDIILPGGMNGFDVLEQIKTNAQTKNIPVIVLTNLVSEEKVAKEIGSSAYVVKSDTTMENVIHMANQLIKDNNHTRR